ncbi:MAG: M14 family zinc carboxypeptidase [bacterium]|nr:M14 family zinc carboxypeptidase [bacterium]
MTTITQRLVFAGLLLVVGLLAQRAQGAEDKTLVRLEAPASALLAALQKEGFDIAAYRPGKYLDLVVTAKERAALEARGLAPILRCTTEDVRRNLGLAPLALPGYRSYAAVRAELSALTAAYPNITALYDIGDSRGKEYATNGMAGYTAYQHDLWALKVSDNPRTEEDEPNIFYLGAHHAREPIGTEIVMTLLNLVLTNAAFAADITNKQIWFVPIVNPDGHKIVYDGSDVWWRKNIRDNNNSGGWNGGDGVDPNRNYGFEWGGDGASATPLDETYRGPAAFSEPETRAIKTLVDAHPFVAGITYHSYSELVLFPYGYAVGMRAPDDAALRELAVRMALSIPGQNGGTYTPQASWELYAASGVTDDYAYGQRGTFCYTIEVAANEFIPPAAQVPGICRNNIAAAVALLRRVDSATLTGHIRDAASAAPLCATVYVQGVDNTGAYRAPYTAEQTFGRYHRFLTAGVYAVTYACFGYRSVQTNAIISASGPTIIDLAMVSAPRRTLAGLVRNADTQVPVTNALVLVTNAPVAAVQTDSGGSFSVTNLPEGMYAVRVSAPGYAAISMPVSVGGSDTNVLIALPDNINESFEQGGFNSLWTFGGSTPWTITSAQHADGAAAARSGVIGDNQSSSMAAMFDVTQAGDVTFYLKTSSESGYDYLRFLVDGVERAKWSGETPWQQVQYVISTGMHTFTWHYSKDANTVGGADAAWVDVIAFPAGVPEPALLLPLLLVLGLRLKVLG